MDQKYLNIISSSELFQNIPKSELGIMLDCLNPQIRSYQRNECIALAGSEFLAIGIVLSGNVTVLKENVAGNRVILSVLDPGDMFGEMAAFARKRVWPATVMAQNEVKALFLPPEKVIGNCQRQCDSHRRLIYNMLMIISNKALALNKKMEYLSIKNLREKISTYLLEFYQQTGKNTFMLPLKRNELADFLNITRPALSREMGRMRDEGIIDFHRSSVQIKDLNALRRILGGE